MHKLCSFYLNSRHGEVHKITLKTNVLRLLTSKHENIKKKKQ